VAKSTVNMKILYGIQLNGNGHITRSIEIIKELRKKGIEVDILTSGNNSNLEIEAKFNFKGISLLNNRNGGINWLKTILKIKLFQLLKDIKIDISDYDLVISDFEPISAMAARRGNKKSISISNQNSLLKENIGFFEKIFIGNFAKCDHSISIDYFRSNNSIQPIIQKDILNKKIKQENYYVIYLPSIKVSKLISEIGKTDKNWIIYTNDNIKCENKKIIIKNINREDFIKDLCRCKGVITASGFSTTSEALVLGKKLWSIPLKGQVEQIINSKKLKKIGIYTGKFNSDNIKIWISNYKEVKYEWENPIKELVKKIIKIYES
jgi:uncharacterized protein (TIGR00661 family)